MNKFRLAKHLNCTLLRSYSKMNSDIILGVYDKSKGLSTTDAKNAAEGLSDSLINKAKWDIGKTRLTYTNNGRTVLVGLGSSLDKSSNAEKVEEESEGEKKDPYKQNNKIELSNQFINRNSNSSFDIETAEKIRECIKGAVKALKSDDRKSTKEIKLDALLAGEGYQRQVIEGAVLGTYDYILPDGEQFDSSLKKKPTITINPLTNKSNDWDKVVIYAESQILAATLCETPANLMTPTIFAETMRSKFDSIKNTSVQIHDREWASSLGMESFLTVAKGSDQEPKVLEVNYKGNPNSDQIDLILVGKGITFDSGGISIKPSSGMKDMKGDMGGAACTVSALHGIARLNLPINVISIAFLCENMPSGGAVKPGDVIRAMNKKSIEIDNTDAEGRLILADALCYASTKNPKIIVDCATLTGAVVVALGHAASGVYTNSQSLWQCIDESGQATNDYMWRMPLFKSKFMKQLKSHVAHLNNIGGRPAGSCTAATFLSEFVDFNHVQHWAHIDIAGTSQVSSEMTGAPTRCLIELASNLNNVE
ncbi:cytosol aminopeptidase [Acrasis kona]|uniref:leucyl aminopeptidase n=1 Tax=Acrasis kona TaxID=1008807 RepID=A0AAW2Z6A7_9EUKA